MEAVDTSGKTHLNFLRDIDQRGNVIAEYIWIDGALGMRAKCRTLAHKITSIADIPEWNYDGSSTYQATTESSEVIIKPVFYFPDPFRGGDNIIVMISVSVYIGNFITESGVHYISIYVHD